MKPDRKICFRVCAAAFLLYLAIHYWASVVRSLQLVVGASVPLIVGCIIAFIANILMSFYERHYFPRSRKAIVQKTRRGMCMLGAFVTAAVVFTGIMLLVVPQVGAAVEVILAGVSDLIGKVLENEELMAMLPENFREAVTGVDWTARLERIAQVLLNGIGDIMGFMTGVVSSIFSTTASMLLGLVFAIYLLMGKDRLKSQVKRVMRAYLKPRWEKKALHVYHVLRESFHNYIVGQMTEAVILGALCALGMLLFRFPYAAMVGVLVGVTALIPIAGAYIGAGVGAFMILTVSPIKALLFLIYLVVLQQIEVNVIYPRVVGTSIGLPGMWVLAAVTVGGGLFGIPGMLIGVPLAAAMYRLLGEDVRRRNRELDELEKSE